MDPRNPHAISEIRKKDCYRWSCLESSVRYILSIVSVTCCSCCVLLRSCWMQQKDVWCRNSDYWLILNLMLVQCNYLSLTLRIFRECTSSSHSRKGKILGCKVALDSRSDAADPCILIMRRCQYASHLNPYLVAPYPQPQKPYLNFFAVFILRRSTLNEYKILDIKEKLTRKSTIRKEWEQYEMLYRYWPL